MKAFIYILGSAIFMCLRNSDMSMAFGILAIAAFDDCVERNKKNDSRN